MTGKENMVKLKTAQYQNQMGEVNRVVFPNT
ncbi:hypothetical protein [Aetokthonos hydrillicola]